VRTLVTAAVIAALALLAWLATPAVAAAPLRRAASHGHAAGATGDPVPARTLPASGAPATDAPASGARATDAPASGAPVTGARAGSRTASAPRLAGINTVALIIGGVAVVVALAILLTRRRPRRGAAAGRPARRPPPGPPTQDLAAAAADALLATDDAVRASEQELGFATARFGERAAAPFSAALQSARAELAAAFKLRQLIDDSVPASEAATRQYLTDISSYCAEASRVLDEQSAAFDRFQDLQARAPRQVAEVDAHITQQSARIDRSRQILDQLAARYTAEAVTVVATNPEDAAERLDFASGSLTSARNELAVGQAGRAVVLLEVAEAGADEAADLLDAVKHMEAGLTQAASGLPAALREVDAEIGEATEVPPGRWQDELARLVAEAQAVATDVRARRESGPFDALAALREIQQADAALDRALAGGREDKSRRERAGAVLDQAMLVARSSVTAAADFISTRRGGVGATARTRRAESQRHFQLAIGSAQHDPEAALTAAQRADALARQATALAEQDVARFDDGELAAIGTSAGLRGAILGGTLIDSLSGGIGPASYGGLRTRGRRSIAHEHSVNRQHSSPCEHSVPGAV